MANFEKFRWTTQSPAIYITPGYDCWRSGADMVYKPFITIHKIGSSSSYGYPVLVDVTVNGTKVVDGAQAKSEWTTTWQEDLFWQSSEIRVRNVSSGTISLSMRFYSRGSARDVTKSYTMEVLPAGAVISTAASGTLGVKQTVTLRDFDSGSCSCNIWLEANGITHTVKNGAWRDFEWTPDLSIAVSNTTGMSVSGTLYCKTYADSNGEQVGSLTSCSVKLTIPSSVCPTVSFDKIEDANGFYQQYNQYIQSLSALNIDCTPSGIYGSTITSFQLTVTGQPTYTSTRVTTGVLTTSGQITLSAKVTDSRGQSYTNTFQLYVMAYAVPHLTAIQVYRSDEHGNPVSDGNYGAVQFSSAVTNLSGNTATYTLLYRQKGQTNWQTVSLTALTNSLTVTNHVVVFGASADYAYDISVQIADKFKTTQSTITPLPSAFILLQTTADGTGLAIGGRATRPGELEIALPTHFSGDFVTGPLFGFGVLPAMPSTDFNLVTVPGSYAIPYSNGGYSNAPASGAIRGVLTVSVADGASNSNSYRILRQVYWQDDCSKIVMRRIYFQNGQWYRDAWRTLTVY